MEDTDYNPSSILHAIEGDQKQLLKKRLQQRRGHEQLIMFLTGFAGAGKSTCVKIAQRFCFEFCRSLSVP